MGSFEVLRNKLEGFTRRYYFNELLKGVILFTALGLLYFLITVFIEYLLWLDSPWRTLLFWCFIGVEFILFLKFIALPLFKLFKIRKGIDHLEASKIIGNHFPEVNDKLLNVLQLSAHRTQSDLLIASIDQKSKALQPIPFKSAVNYRSNTKYLKYALIPLLIIVMTYISGNQNWFNSSYKRVVNYSTAYEPPAPFQFFVLNEHLEAIENKPFVLEVKTSGELLPESVGLRYNDETYYLQPLGEGRFQFVFSRLNEDVYFELFANNVLSKTYHLKVLRAPALEVLEMTLNYPRHTAKQNEVIKSTGNTVIPEGTSITWTVKTRSASEVKIYSKDTLLFNQLNENSFKARKQLFANYDYDIVTGNLNLKDYERLAYQIKVVKDDYPELSIESRLDSLDQQSLYFFGQASDDYGLRNLNLVYYRSDEPTMEQRVPISDISGNYAEFFSSFPDNLQLEEGVSYELYFELSDNDRINGFKTTKSGVFNYRKRTEEEQSDQKLNQQSETIKNMDNTFKKLEEQDKRLEEISKTQKEKEALNFNDRKKFESFLKRQKQQEELMKNFNKNLQENLEEFNPKEEDPFKEELKKRLEENEKQLEQDEKLLKELEEIKDKINKEDFSQKLEDLAKQNQNKKRSMKQLLELTKRFYVSKKAEKIQKRLEDLSEKQEKIAEQDQDNNSGNQKKLNEEFSKIREELDALKKENSQLKKPMPVPEDRLTEERISKDQREATEALEKKEAESQDQKEQQQSEGEAQRKQKAAAKKMQKMSENMKKMQQSGGGAGGPKQMAEDAEMLRQILDNLILFSFDQEKLMNQFKSIDIDNNQYGSYIIDQSTLRSHFEHVDDSLFSLSLRQPRISEKVNKQISEVYYNIDKALNQLTENRLYQGVSYQQYSVTAANELASLLSDMLDNMEQQLNMMPGSEGGGEMQLPDIIMSQEQLNEMMKQGMKQSQGEKDGKEKGEKEGEGEKPKDSGEGDQEGAKGTEGEKEGKEGDKGKGEQGQGGDQPQEGNGESKSEKNGYGEGGSEEMNKELYEIFRKQQQIRQALENKIQESDGTTQQQIKNLIERMEEVESDLINKGFTNQTMEKMLDLQHRLLKLENATFIQGEEERRESKTNFKQYEGESERRLKVKQYFNRTETLNRQALPLKEKHKKKVRAYFKTKDDQL